MPRFHFRVRFRLPEDCVLGSEERTLSISLPSDRRTYVLEAVGGQTMNDSHWFLVKDIGDGFATQHEALKAGRVVKNAVMWWGMMTQVGVDVGNDSTNTWVTQYVIDQARQEQGIRLLNEMHGLQVYEEDPDLPTRFIVATLKSKISKGIENFEQYFSQAVEMNLELTDRETLAFELYGLSHFEAAGRARFLTLISAIESISQAKPRSPEGLSHVEKMISLTRQSSLPKSEIASMIGSLNWLRQESIGKTCRDLVESFLGDEPYGEKTAKKFFQDCYSVRSELVHSGTPSDDSVNVNALIGELDRLVADLLAASARR